MLSYLAVGVMGVLFFAGDSGAALSTLVGTLLLLLLVAVRNTWDLLVTVADKAPANR